MNVQPDFHNTDEEEEEDENGFGRSKSQLSVIFEVLGTPSDEELSYLDERTAGILKRLKKRPTKVKKYKCIIFKTHNIKFLK